MYFWNVDVDTPPYCLAKPYVGSVWFVPDA